MKDSYKNVGQFIGPGGSMDCGYFCGYVVNLWNKHGPSKTSSMRMSQKEVYDARNRFKSPANPEKEPSGPDIRTIGITSGTQMVRYLATLNCHGFHAEWIVPGKKNSWSDDPVYIRALLYKHVPSSASKDAMLFAVDSAIAGHWITVLNAGNGSFEYYDPASKPNGRKLTEAQLLALLSRRGLYRNVFSYIEGISVHKVKIGESISSIAGLYWKGDVLLWPLIYDANKQAIGPNWNQLRVGQELLIPSLNRYESTELDEARVRGRTW